MAIGSPMFIGGIGAACVGMVLQIIAVATPSWSSMDLKSLSQERGLFRHCACGDLDEDYVTSELKSVRAMAIIGILTAIGGVALLLIYVVFAACGRSFLSKTYLISGIACLFGCLFILIGVIIYATEVNDENFYIKYDLSYSFVLSILGGILLAVGGVLVLVGGRY